MSVRLFAAVAVPEHVRDGVDAALADLRGEHPRLRWVDPDSWHLTLAFVGWVDEAQAAGVDAAVRAAAPACEPFTLRLDGRVGGFARRVLWAGIEDSSALAGLAERVREELRARDLPAEDRPFRAHLTVARAPRDRRMPAGIGEGWRGPESEWRVDEVLVMRSHLGRGGARYEVRLRAPLGV